MERVGNPPSDMRFLLHLVIASAAAARGTKHCVTPEPATALSRLWTV